MNTIVISSVVADLNGSIQFKFDPSKTQIYSMERRVSRRPTLDGGSSFDDFGFSHTDRTIVIGGRMNGSQIDSMNYLLQTFSSVVISIVDGLYLAALQSTAIKGSEVTLSILIKEKLA